MCFAHSWYRHIPLTAPFQFVVFLAADAGEGYPSMYPAVASGNSVEGYREEFGFLDYVWRDPRGRRTWNRDAGGRIEGVDPRIEERCGFLLGPQSSAFFSNAVQVICLFWSTAGRSSRARDGGWMQWPDEPALQELVSPELRARIDELHAAQERAGALRGHEGYREAWEEIEALYEALRAPEVAKIRHALQNLEDLRSREPGRAFDP